MRNRLGAAVGLVAWLLWLTAAADTFYKYRSKETGRDVYVNGLDQVPLKYRSQAKVVLEGAPAAKPEDATDKPASPADGEPEKRGRVTIVPSTKPALDPSLAENLRKAAEGKSLWQDGPSMVTAVVDARLAQSGHPVLTPAEREGFSSLLRTTIVIFLVAGVLALGIWIWQIVDALRDGRVLWGILMFIVSPLTYVYLLIHGGANRTLYKIGCALGLAAPTLVAAVGAWRFYAWLDAVMRARGGHL